MKIIKVFSLSALVGLALVACNNSSDLHQLAGMLGFCRI